jgi:hypothetical protein
MIASFARAYPIWKLHLEAARRSESKAQLDMGAYHVDLFQTVLLTCRVTEMPAPFFLLLPPI